MDSGKQVGCGAAALGALVFFPSVGVFIALFIFSVTFNQNIGGHIKRAADANTVEIAKTELATVVKNMESAGMTKGSTGIFYNTPDTDIEFWYKNTKACHDQLNELPANAQATDRETVLLKLRQTLLDHTKDGERVTAPPGIECYPNIVLWAVLELVAFFGVIIGFFAIIFGIACVVKD